MKHALVEAFNDGRALLQRSVNADLGCLTMKATGCNLTSTLCADGYGQAEDLTKVVNAHQDSFVEYIAAYVATRRRARSLSLAWAPPRTTPQHRRPPHRQPGPPTPPASPPASPLLTLRHRRDLSLLAAPAATGASAASTALTATAATAASTAAASVTAASHCARALAPASTAADASRAVASAAIPAVPVAPPPSPLPPLLSPSTTPTSRRRCPRRQAHPPPPPSPARPEPSPPPPPSPQPPERLLRHPTPLLRNTTFCAIVDHTVVGTTVVGTTIVGSTIVDHTIVGTTIVGTTIVGTTITFAVSTDGGIAAVVASCPVFIPRGAPYQSLVVVVVDAVAIASDGLPCHLALLFASVQGPIPLVIAVVVVLAPAAAARLAARLLDDGGGRVRRARRALLLRCRVPRPPTRGPCRRARLQCGWRRAGVPVLWLWQLC